MLRKELEGVDTAVIICEPCRRARQIPNCCWSGEFNGSLRGVRNDGLNDGLNVGLSGGPEA
jgi:hypothetical protein